MQIANNIQIKKLLIIFHDQQDFSRIYRRILMDYGPTMGISWKLKKTLGFTVRRHRAWQQRESLYDQPSYFPEDQMHLDFVDEASQTFFCLKYLQHN